MWRTVTNIKLLTSRQQVALQVTGRLRTRASNISGERHLASAAHPSHAADDAAPHYRKILLLGPPGSGKGTYAKQLAPILDVIHVCPGEMIRAETRSGSSLGKLAAEYTRRGELLPAELIARVMAGSLGACKKGFLLDGFPRNREQAEMLDEFADLDIVIAITMREDALNAKLAGRRICPDCQMAFNTADVSLNNGSFAMPPLLPTSEACVRNRCVDRFQHREDDMPHVIERRLQIYAEETQQLIDYYEPRGIVKHIDILGGQHVMLPAFKSTLGVE